MKKNKLKIIEEANKRILSENNINEVGGTLNTNLPNYMDGPSKVGIQLQLDQKPDSNKGYINIDFGEAWSYDLTEKAVQAFKGVDEEKRGELLKDAGDAILNSIKEIMTSCVDGVCDSK